MLAVCVYICVCVPWVCVCVGGGGGGGRREQEWANTSVRVFVRERVCWGGGGGCVKDRQTEMERETEIVYWLLDLIVPTTCKKYPWDKSGSFHIAMAVAASNLLSQQNTDGSLQSVPVVRVLTFRQASGRVTTTVQSSFSGFLFICLFVVVVVTVVVLVVVEVTRMDRFLDLPHSWLPLYHWVIKALIVCVCVCVCCCCCCCCCCREQVLLFVATHTMSHADLYLTRTRALTYRGKYIHILLISYTRGTYYVLQHRRANCVTTLFFTLQYRPIS